MYMTKTYNITDIDCELIVEITSKRKEIFDWYDGSDGVCFEDDSFEILYDDGHVECFVGGDYLPKISRQHIVSMVYGNSATYIVYGNYEINENGIVYASSQMKIDENIVEVK